MDKFLESMGYTLTYGELKPEERATVHKWYDAIKKSELTINMVRDNVNAMKAEVENELTKPNITEKEDMYLKARLRNYLLLEGLLSTPEKARRAIEREMGK